jgi:hypothetical protein
MFILYAQPEDNVRRYFNFFSARNKVSHMEFSAPGVLSMLKELWLSELLIFQVFSQEYSACCLLCNFHYFKHRLCFSRDSFFPDFRSLAVKEFSIIRSSISKTFG